MPFGGNDWLALTQEPTLEPDLPICDPITTSGTSNRTHSLPAHIIDELAADITAATMWRSTVFIEARSMYRRRRAGGMRPGRRVEVRAASRRGHRHGLYGPGRAGLLIRDMPT